MLFCMLKWYPIDTTTVPTWACMGEVVFATSLHAGTCRMGTALLQMTQHKRVCHLDLVMMYFVRVSLWGCHACIGKVCDWNSWLLVSY